MIDDKLKAKLHLLNENGIQPNFAELSREYGMDYRTIKRYYNGYEGKPATRNKPSKLDSYKDLIKKKLEIERINMRAVYEFLVDKYGNEEIGTYSNFAKYVKRENLQPKKEKSIGFPRFETKEGYQAQVDWKEDITLTSCHGEVIKFNIFNLELGYSRYNCIYYSRYKEQNDVFRCMIRAFKRIGGVPCQIVFDNMSTVAIAYEKNRKKKVNPRMKHFAEDFGFEPYLCVPRHAYTKGKVEARNKMLDWIRAYDNDFEDENELIDIIENLIQKKMNEYICQATNYPPALLLQEEMKHLNTIPPEEIQEFYTGTIRQTVRKDSLVYYQGNRYSVDPAYINERVGIESHEGKVYIYHHEKLISIHEEFGTLEKKRIRYRKDDYAKLMAPHYMEIDAEELEQKVLENLEMMDRLIGGNTNVQSTDEQSKRTKTT